MAGREQSRKLDHHHVLRPVWYTHIENGFLDHIYKNASVKSRDHGKTSPKSARKRCGRYRQQYTPL